MSESLRNLVTLIPTWVAATQNVNIPALPNEEELEMRVAELRSRLRDGTWRALNLKADDRGLAVLSRLCFEFSKFSIVDDSLCEAAAAHELVSGLTWPPDLLEEQAEILSQLALVAWRQSSQLGTTKTMLAWEKKYRIAFSRSFAEHAYLEQFLATELSERSTEATDLLFSDVRAMFGIFELIGAYRNSRPARAAAEASFCYEWISEHRHFAPEWERSYLLGTMALLAGSGHRIMGQRESAARWFDRAHSFLSKLRCADAELARLAYGRLTLSYELRQFDRVLKGVPLLLARFRTLGLEEEEIKCLYVEGMALKESGRLKAALPKFLLLEQRLIKSDPCLLLGGVISRIGNLYSAMGRHRDAMVRYQQALPLLHKSGRPCMVAGLKGSVGETCRDLGNLETAIDLYRDALSDYCQLGLGTLAAYMRIVLAETLLLAGRPREAEIEILAALPTIEKERMVEEGFAALNLLRESVDRSQTDASSLRALRERLKGDVQ